MNRPFLIILSIAAMSAMGCQATGPRVQISPEHAKQLNLSLSGGVAADKAGSVYLTTPGTLMRYEPGRNRLEDLLNDPRQDLQDVSVTPEGAVLALCSRELCAYVPGNLLRLYTLPGPATALSCDREFAYVLTSLDKGSRLLRITLTGTGKGAIQPLLTTQDRPRALCAVRGGCLMASGGNIVKVTDPAPSTDGTGNELTTVLLVSVQEPITSIAADQGKLIVYFATPAMTYAWIQGQVVPVFPAGSRLALSKDTLTICLASGTDSQLIQIPGASQHAQRLLSELNKKTQPRKR
jgi:hypothetical protein